MKASARRLSECGERGEELDLRAVVDERDLVRCAAEQVVDHGGQAAHVAELAECGARALDDHDQVEAEGVGVFVDADGLRDAVIEQGELRGLEAVEHVALVSLDLGGDEDEVRLTAEGEGGLAEWSGSLCE